MFKKSRGSPVEINTPQGECGCLFSRVLGPAPQVEKRPPLKASQLQTPLGPMIAVADEQALYLLEFLDRKQIERQIARVKRKMQAGIIEGRSKQIDSIQQELEGYFNGFLSTFKTPIALHGSPFQRLVWEELQRIPVGETRSYAQVAWAIGQPTAYRAVANANGANALAIVIPCHRVILKSGELCGYAGGVMRKNWLLQHERREGEFVKI